MRTRAAAKKLADAVMAVGNAVSAPIEPTAVSQALVTTATPESMAISEPSTKTTGGGTKRKRGGKKPAQPVKGGWVLPHGMGIGVAGEDTSAPQDAEDTLPASSVVDPAPDAGGATQSGLAVTSELAPNAEKKVLRQTRQTRLSLRVTKAKPIVKLEEPDDPSIKLEDGRPTKRVRIAPVAAKTTTDAASDKGALELTVVKSEEKKILGQPAPKVLIIKGITIKDDVVARTASKLIVDASQLLDPNLRRMVKRGKENPYGLTPGFSPYPYRRVPTPEACEEVHSILTELHGEVKQPEKMPVASLEVAGCGEVPCVLDALLRTLISGNTLMALADAAIKKLADHYGLRQEGTGAGSINWDKARLSSHQELANVIKVAGNGPKRSQHIKQILDMVYEENVQRAKMQSAAVESQGQAVAETGKATQNLLSLDHMHGMSKDEALAKFVSYPGIGIKTAACVTLFCLRMPCFAVDTHVHKFCRWLGWVPEKADPDNCFRHGDFMVPDHLKYGLHQLFIRHGQVCFKCRKATKPGTKDWNEAPDCPLEHLLDRSKDEAGSKAKPPRKVVKEETSSGSDDSDSEEEEEEDEE
ncbi:DNA glycosylase [Parachaetomium inaequale]|uniref:DNA glycosylase n=1 Tax=Parachaetomium inaequale TaxID=2588326 RepID=A0AAN6PPU1_9PEZI|nr:DNA glycosylase [Parachaetomium inaequale]